MLLERRENLASCGREDILLRVHEREHHLVASGVTWWVSNGYMTMVVRFQVLSMSDTRQYLYERYTSVFVCDLEQVLHLEPTHQCS